MSDSKSSTSSSGGIGLCGAVFIVFLILKLAEVGAVAAWSWWAVTAPLWVPLTVVLGVLFAFLAIKIFVLAIVAPIVDWSNARAAMR